MDNARFDRLSRVLAQRSLTRRQALARGGAGLAAAAAAGLTSAAAAQDATPTVAPEGGGESPSMLFLQTYQSGTISPVEGAEGRYTVTLEAGTGQTVYFSDRPGRIVGADPTPQFLEGLGFQPGNPPNAALVVETAPGETDIAVVELFNPLYDPVSQGVTYEVEVLANWQDELELGLSEAPTDLASLAPSFGAAQLFIDDCADSNLSCCPEADLVSGVLSDSCRNVVHDFGTVGYCYQWGHCVPCDPYFHDAPSSNATWLYWNAQCDQEFPDLCTNGSCIAGWWVS